MTLKERCRKLEADYNDAMYTDGSGLERIEAFAKEVRKEALEEAAHMVNKTASEHKINSHLREAICARIRAFIEKEQD